MKDMNELESLVIEYKAMMLKAEEAKKRADEIKPIIKANFPMGKTILDCGVSVNRIPTHRKGGWDDEALKTLIEENGKQETSFRKKDSDGDKLDVLLGENPKVLRQVANYLPRRK